MKLRAIDDLNTDLNEAAAALGIKKQNAHARAVKEGWPYTEETTRGGRRRLYLLSNLPAAIRDAVTVLRLKHAPKPELPARTFDADVPDPVAMAEADAGPAFSYDAEALWQWAATRKQTHRDIGAHRGALLQQVVRLMEAGHTWRQAADIVGRANDISPHNLRNWYYGVNGKPGAQSFEVQDWAAALMPGWTGGGRREEIPAQAWDWYSTYYLSRGGQKRQPPTVANAYRRVCEVAKKEGWGELPSEKTFERRTKEIPMATRVYLREGPEALAKMYPPQRRDKTVFAAGEAVVGDGLKFDKLWVKFTDGEILNTATGWFWADVRSNYLLAYRLAKTENTDLFRLATYDLTAVTVPKHVWVDNTVVAANKAMTGRAQGRHRFHDRKEDPIGLILQLGMELHFTNPDKVLGSPGAKPIERSFGIGGIHEAVATHPRLINRGYSRDTAVPFDEFAQVVAEEVVRFNQQAKRRTDVCRGVLSFEQAFRESFEAATVRRLTDAQRDLLLLMPEVVRANKRSGELALQAGRGPMGQHRYWAEPLAEYKTHQLVAYYDPENLSKPVAVYTLDGRYICRADNITNTGFNDKASAREHGKNKQRFMKANKIAATAQNRMSDLEMAAQYPVAEGAEPPEPGMVQGVFTAKKRVINGELVDTETGEIVNRDADFARGVSFLAAVRANSIDQPLGGDDS
jgi:hypothetical protein